MLKSLWFLRIIANIILVTISVIVLGILWGYVFGYDDPLLWIWVWLVAGLVVGIVGGAYKIFIDLPPKALLNYRSVVVYRPTRCGQCRGKGRRQVFIFFKRKCRGCGGRGSVLVAEKSEKCAWCQGKGRGLLFRCPVCSGTGWAYSGIEKE